jgi:hypothetical protein
MLIRFFDKLEDRVRGWFSHYPIFYGFFGGIGVVLFWRGVWHTADWISALLMDLRTGNTTVDLSAFPDGPVSFLIGSVMLLTTGLFVSNFIGNEIIISGLRGEKKLAEKTETEVKTETGAIGQIQKELRQLNRQLADLRKERSRRRS